jgi:hypothetical protein
MDITDVIKEFVGKYKEDESLSFKHYYNDLIESKVEVSFGQDCDAWDDVLAYPKLGLHVEFFKDFPDFQMQEIFDVLIANCDADHAYFQDFFERYGHKTSDLQCIDIYKKYFIDWYGARETCDPSVLLAMFDRVVNMCDKKDKEIEKLDDEVFRHVFRI